MFDKCFKPVLYSICDYPFVNRLQESPMQNLDVIQLANLILTIATLLLNSLVLVRLNSINNRAKRTEIALQASSEPLRELYELISKHNRNMEQAYQWSIHVLKGQRIAYHNKSGNPFLDNYYEAAQSSNTLKEYIDKNGLFIPKSVRDKYNIYDNLIASKPFERDYPIESAAEVIQEAYVLMDECTNAIFSEMQKFIGYD